MPHLHSDLQAVDRRVSEIVGSDRVLDSHLRTENGAIEIEVESLEAVDVFTEHFDGAVMRTRSFQKLHTSSVAVVDGITVTVSGHGYVSAVSA